MTRKRIKAFYTVAELAEITGYHRDTIRSLLRRLDVRVVGGGRKGCTMLVPVSEVVEKLDVIFSSHKFAESVADSDEGKD